VNAPQVAITDGFLRASHKLTPAQSRFVEEALLKLQDGYNAVHLHALAPLPFKSFVVNQGALRVICLQEGPLLILLHVDAHDAAYEWARRHKVVQVGRSVRILPMELDEAKPAAEKEPPLKGPLAEVPDKTFRHFGVGPFAANALRLVPSEDALLDLAQHLDNSVGVALVSLASEPEALDRIVREFEDARQTRATKPSLAEIIHDESNAATLWVPPPGEKLLQRALEGSFASWRVFLHPTQLRVVRRRAKGAMKVSGGPGTGKTVVALHRARFLAEEIFRDDPRPIALTSFTRVLTQELGTMLSSLLEGGVLPATRFAVRSIAGIVQDVLKSAGRSGEVLGEDALGHAWEEAMEKETLGKPLAFYRSEREHVVVRSAAWSEPAYLQAERIERHSRLDRSERRKVWAVIEAFERAISERGGGDLSALARDATAALASGEAKKPFAAIVCDESQDVGPAELRFLAALAADNDGKVRANALFLAGDGYQRIYKSPLNLHRCGVDVRGNSMVLKLNYRTTEGIRRAAVQLVEKRGEPIDGEETEGQLDGYRSLRNGPPPERRTFSDRDREADWIAEQIRSRSATETLVLARTNALVDQLRERLKSRGIEAQKLGEEESSGGARVVLCTLHRAKGLEASNVIIACTDKIPARYRGGGDETDKVLWERQEESLLYVAITRARDWCALTGLSAGASVDQRTS
jgi:hypothetical protein